MTKEKVQAVEKEGTQFKRLILQNPNYFSSELENSFEPVLSMLNNTQYEENTCIGFNIDFDMLEATGIQGVSQGCHRLAEASGVSTRMIIHNGRWAVPSSHIEPSAEGTLVSLCERESVLNGLLEVR